MSLLAAVVESSPSEYYFQLSSSGGGDVSTSPAKVVSTPLAQGALVLEAADSQTCAVYGSAQGVAIAANAVLTLGCASSQESVIISNSASKDTLSVCRTGVSGINITSAATSGGVMQINGDSAVGTETIQFGPNTNALNALQVGPALAVSLALSPYTSQVVVPQLANGTGTIPGASGVVLSNPATPGLYLISASCSSLDGPSVASQMSTIAMWNGATWKTGGVIEVPNGAGTVSFSPAPGTAATINFFNASGGNLVNMSFIKFPLFNGLISGMP
jgi:hypothetical protein